MIRERKGWWIGGTVVALAGVALVRLLAPELAASHSRIASAVGYVLVIAGIAILARATRRRPPEAFITVGKDARD